MIIQVLNNMVATFFSQCANVKRPIKIYQVFLPETRKSRFRKFGLGESWTARRVAQTRNLVVFAALLVHQDFLIWTWVKVWASISSRARVTPLFGHSWGHFFLHSRTLMIVFCTFYVSSGFVTFWHTETIFNFTISTQVPCCLSTGAKVAITLGLLGAVIPVSDWNKSSI